MEQRTAEWFEARLGKLTGSRADTAFKTYKSGANKGKPTEEAQKLMLEIAFERLTGNGIDHFESQAMAWGTEHEADARAEYEDTTGNLVTQVGFIDHPEINNFGASPDGLVGDDGLLEIKCPSELTHLKRVLTGEVPPEYKTQMIVQLICTGRKWCDYVDYDPRLSVRPLMIVRFEPTEEERKDVEEKAKTFLSYVDKLVNDLKSGPILEIYR